MRNTMLKAMEIGYQHVAKPVFFKMDPEFIHVAMTRTGEFMGHMVASRALIKGFWGKRYPELAQTVAGITFPGPIGLSAGFDYEARLPLVLPSLGFGFGTIGTITNTSYGGNPRPMLGRLPKSRSLMVNKGFKNDGAAAVAHKLEDQRFTIPIGISIGRTNTPMLKTQSQSIKDIVTAFKLFEMSECRHAYYELNISCPNLFGEITFYPPKNLEDLLREIDTLHLSRPVFIKMPIEKSDRDVIKMLEVIVKHHIAGVIFGNLQKNRHDPSLDQNEVAKFPKGYFSGKPTFVRSNHLIALAYHEYHKKLVIIGCGGVFSAEDAYQKITLGASLVQLITGMIYQGPQLIAQINIGLVDLLRKDGFKTIHDAIGSANQTTYIEN